MKHLSLLAFCLMVLAGCANEPAWVAAPPRVLCYSQADQACVSEMIAISADSEQPGPSRDDAISMTRALAVGVGIAEPKTLVRIRERNESVMCMRPSEEFRIAGAAIHSARQKNFTSALEALGEVRDPKAKLVALGYIATLASRTDNESAIARALNELSEQDQLAYMDALQQRLLTLLSTGDLERAESLRESLLEFYSRQPSPTMSVAQIAISYATSGRVQDANAFLRRASSRVQGLNTADMRVLLELVIRAANGDYPPPQDFFAFSSDVMRLEAYVQLAILFDRSGQDAYATRAATDMVRFAQKSSFKVPRSMTGRAFSKVLVEAM